MNAWLQAGCLNALPALGVSEVQADLPCALELWQAPNAVEFKRLLKARSDPEAQPDQRGTITGSRLSSSRTMPPPSIKSIRHGVEILTSDDMQWQSLSSSFRIGVNRMELILMIIGTSPLSGFRRHLRASLASDTDS